jgi:hypothetical protein
MGYILPQNTDQDPLIGFRLIPPSPKSSLPFAAILNCIYHQISGRALPVSKIQAVKLIICFQWVAIFGLHFSGK